MSVLIPSQARRIQSLCSHLTRERERFSFQESSYFISDNLAEIGSEIKMHQILVINSTVERLLLNAEEILIEIALFTETTAQKIIG